MGWERFLSNFNNPPERLGLKNEKPRDARRDRAVHDLVTVNWKQD
jgi:hypothetical protein